MLGLTKRTISEKDSAARSVAQLQSSLFTILNNLNPIILELNLQNEIKNCISKETSSFPGEGNPPEQKTRSRNNSSSSHSSKLSGETNASMMKSSSICSNNNNVVSHISRNETDTSMNNAIFNGSAQNQSMQASNLQGSNSKCRGGQNFSKVLAGPASAQQQFASAGYTPQQASMNSSKKLTKHEMALGMDQGEDPGQILYGFHQAANGSTKSKEQHASMLYVNSGPGAGRGVSGGKPQPIGGCASLPPQVPNQNSSKKGNASNNLFPNFYYSPSFNQNGGHYPGANEVEHGALFSNSQSDILNNEESALKLIKAEECTENNTVIEHESVSHKENFFCNMASDNESQKMDDLLDGGSFRTMNNNFEDDQKLSQSISPNTLFTMDKEISQTLTETYVYSENKNVYKPEEEHHPPGFDMMKKNADQTRSHALLFEGTFSVPAGCEEKVVKDFAQGPYEEALSRTEKSNKPFLSSNPSIRMPAGRREGPDEGEFFIAKFDFKPQKANDLQFSKGDLLQIVKRTSNGWWIGVLKKSGDMGYVPSNFLEKIQNN